MILVAVLLPIYPLRADPGTLDTSFDSGTALGTACCTAPFGVYSIGLQTNGMMVVGGYFEGFIADNATRNFLARLNTNGFLDTSFNAKLGTNNGFSGSVGAVALQPDGKIVIGGGFTNINGVTCNRIARLNADGSLDTTFNPSSGVDGNVNAVARQKDGKLVIGGSFANVNGVPRARLARLNSDGSLDTDFNLGAGAGANNTVSAIALQSDGRVLAGGVFTNINGTNQNRIARLNADGSLDTTFNPPSGIDNGSGAVRRVLSIVVQPDGKILVGGWFSSANGQPCTGIVRLATDGTTDTNFSVSCLHQSGLGGDLGYVNAIALQSDGKIIVGGNFFINGGATNSGISRLNPDGSLDISFNPGNAGSYINSVAIQPDGKLVIGGEFTSFAGVARYHLARLDGDPVLQEVLIGNQLVLCWPATYTNFILESATDLNLPLDWTTNPNPAVISGDQFVVTNWIDGTSGFYRLKR
ncbi:MAG: Delta-60 repeat-containing protein [Pedosphaera sp.]|nr:Delta-60 repeat-containing protein [Pedosphaera sp.]